MTALTRLRNLTTAVLDVTRILKSIWQTQPTIFCVILLLEGIQGFLPLAIAWVTKLLFDLIGDALQRDLAVGYLVETAIVILVIRAFLSVITQIASSILGYFHSELGRKLSISTQLSVYHKINSFVGLEYLEDPKFHDTTRLAIQGAMSAPIQTLTVVTSLWRSLITLASFIGVIFGINPLLACALLIGALPELVVQFKLGQQRFTLASYNSPKEREAFYYGQILSEVHYAKELRLYDSSRLFLEKFRQLLGEIHQTQRKQARSELYWQLLLRIVSNLVGSAVFILIVLQALSKQFTIGDMTLYLGAVGTVQSALVGAVFAFSTLHEARLFYTQFKNLIALPVESVVTEHNCSLKSLSYSIEFRNVSFRYSEQQPWILRNIDLLIPKGSTVALVGQNGAGKTTLIKLLTRLYEPTRGQILLDGVDIQLFDPVELRQRIGVIFQDFIRYDMTVQENIGLGNIQRISDHNRIEKAAKDAGIHHVIENLPQGYSTTLSRWLSEDKLRADLSGGEWQKIAIARMFMRDADLFILDEPTAALDVESEFQIYARFVELMADRTNLLISHRFSTVRMADIIAVLEDGRITEYGSHDQLLALHGTYARLYNMQIQQYVRSSSNPA